MPQILFRSKYPQEIESGQLSAKYSVRGDRILRYFINIHHKKLRLHKEVSATEISLLQMKVDTLLSGWDSKYEDVQKKGRLAAGAEAAEQSTVEATQKLEMLLHILKDTLSVDDRVNWDSLRDGSRFIKPLIFLESSPVFREEPVPTYIPPTISLLETILLRKNQIIAKSNAQHKLRLQNHEMNSQIRRKAHSEALVEWQSRKDRYERDVIEERSTFLSAQGDHNSKVALLANNWRNGHPESIIEHAGIVLEKSDYKGLFEKSYEIDFNEISKMLLVEYDLPSPSSMPTLKSVRFVKASGELKEAFISEKEKSANYDLVCYQICLRTIHELYEADEWKHIQLVVFNGFATDVDLRTGRDVRSCIMSVAADQPEFESIDLRRVEPKACFKKLKGVSASALSALAAESWPGLSEQLRLIDKWTPAGFTLSV